MRDYIDDTRDPAVRGLWHDAVGEPQGVLVVGHGAGSNARAPVLEALAQAFAAAGYAVLRCDLPFRQARPNGPPLPAAAARDRTGIENAVLSARARVPGRILLGGHSYGGRQASMLAAEKPEVADALLLLSYPLHPPRKPADLRTAHFSGLRTPTFFVHGTRDPFASPEELRHWMGTIPAKTELLVVEKAGHDLGKFQWAAGLPDTLEKFLGEN
jgi:predicted alpha/beta-hydrolase family hydrolase